MRGLLCRLLIIAFLTLNVTEGFSGEFNGKLGTSYADEPAKFGLDISLNYYYLLDPYFVTGIEGDFFWIKWDRTMGSKEIGQTTAAIKAKTNVYIMPVFFNAQVRLPKLAEKIYVEPSLTVGLGYSFMLLDNSIPEYTDSGVTQEARDEIKFYSGFAWQVIASISFRPDPDSRVHFTVDAGFRGTKPERENIEFNMSGFLTRVGVKFYI